MIKKTLFLSMLLVVGVVQLFAQSESWQIRTADELYAFANYVNASAEHRSANAVLMNDIVVNEQVFADDSYTLVDNASALRKWTPIDRFTGTIDGQGHTISGLYCENEYRAGFIREVDSGSITNLGIINSYFRGHEIVGGLASFVMGNSKVSSCWVKDCHLLAYCDQSSIETPEQIFELGGVVGSMSGQQGNIDPTNPILDKCFFIGKLTGGDGKYIYSASIGGIVGTMNEILTNCYAIASISQNDVVSWNSFVGQIVGRARTLTPYSNCYAQEASIVGNVAEIKANDSSYEEPAGSVRTKEEFASGLVSYLLNGSESGKTDGWRQRIDGEAGQRDAYPVLQATENNFVYAGTVECPNNEFVQSNSEVQPKSHSFQIDNVPSAKVSVPLYEMHCANDGCTVEKPNALVIKAWNGTDPLELSYELVESTTDERSLCPITIDAESKQCLFTTAIPNLTIEDSKPYYSPVDFLVPGTLMFNRNFVKDTGYYTLFMPFTVKAEIAAEMGSVYTFDKIKDGEAHYSKYSDSKSSQDLLANTGYMFLPEKTFSSIASENTVVKASTSISDPTTTAGKTHGHMYGTYTMNTPIPRGVYGYYEHDGKAYFAWAKTGATLKQFRAYLYLSGSASANQYSAVFVNDDDPTATKSACVEEFDANAPIFDLWGNCVKVPLRGNIYLQNGRKIIMK